MNDKQYVYWYKLPEYKDPYSEGYIGITKRIKTRIEEHKAQLNKGKNNHLYNSMRKHGYENIEIEILHIVNTREEAGELEHMYRPDKNIGWNSSPGGLDIMFYKTVQVSLYHKDSYPILHTFNSYAEAGKALGISASKIQMAYFRKSTNYGYDGWAILFDKNFDRTKSKTISESRSNSLKGIKRSKPNMWKGCTNRWSEEDKIRIGNQHRGKKISEEQKKSMSIKNRIKNPSCKKITLKHKDSDKEYTYHSISEASRQLDIPLSRIKSKAQRPLNRYGHDGWAIIHLGLN